MDMTTVTSHTHSLTLLASTKVGGAGAILTAVACMQ